MAPADSFSNVHSPHAGTTGPGERERIDDPDRFQTAKNQKTTLIEGIRQFNFKPKRGIKFLITHGFIRSTKPKDVARFLLTADGLSKAMIGEYLGEGYVLPIISETL
jgi:brefeldin A-inhibited guanine nucleotide-exchange protein